MELSRRKFLGGLGALIGGIAVEQAIPFNRVWSFPKKIVIADVAQYEDFIEMSNLAFDTSTLAPLMTIYYDRKAVECLKENFIFSTS